MNTPQKIGVENGCSEKEKSFCYPHFWQTLTVLGIVLFILLHVAHQMPLTWDEGDAFDRADLVMKWFSLFKNNSDSVGESLLSPETIKHYWEHTIYREGHPAGYSVVNAFGKSIFDSFGQCLGLKHDNNSIFSQKTSYRFGVLLLFSLAITAVYHRISRDYNKKTAFFAILAILLLPRVFGHSTLAVCDSPLMSAWLLTWAFFDSALKKNHCTILWGTLLGLGLSIKFPGWIIPVPFLIWIVYVYRKNLWCHDVQRILFIGIPVALITFYLLNPPIWTDPYHGFLTFVKLNTHRESNFNIPIFFFGTMYNLKNPLPWYNGLLWTAMTVPPGLIFLSLCANRDRKSLLLFLNYFILILVRMIPGIPVHDGVRLFIAAFPFVGILAGIGAGHLWERSQKTSLLLTESNLTKSIKRNNNSKRDRSIKDLIPDDKQNGNTKSENNQNTRMVSDHQNDQSNQCFKNDQTSQKNQNDLKKTDSQTIYPPKNNKKNLLRFEGIFFVLTIYLVSAINIILYAPQWLSYFSALFGGPAVMKEKGTEITYYWDSLDDIVLKQINEIYKMPEMKDKKILFNSCSPKMLQRYNDWGILIPPAETTGNGNKNLFDYGLYVVQYRLSGMSEFDRYLVKKETPLAVKSLTVRRNLFYGKTDLVPLLYLFDSAKAGKTFLKLFAAEQNKSESKPKKSDPKEDPTKPIRSDKTNVK